MIDTVSGASRRNSYPNGDIVYNNTSLYLATVTEDDIKNLKGDSETKKLRFYNFSNYPEGVPYNLMDVDLINAYIKFIKK